MIRVLRLRHAQRAVSWRIYEREVQCTISSVWRNQVQSFRTNCSGSGRGSRSRVMIRKASGTMKSEYELISSTSELTRVLSSFQGSRPICAIDTEVDMTGYAEKLGLIQIACEDYLGAVDVLAIDNLEPLQSFLEHSEPWFHGAESDMVWLKRTFGSIPSMIYDTQIAARLVGYSSYGLASLVEEFFDVKLSKKFQRQRWSMRPLPDDMLEYAINDAKYTLMLRNILVGKLKQLGRYHWFIESCKQGRTRAIARLNEPQKESWRIKGSGTLEKRGLAYLREIHRWRDDEAKRKDRPLYTVMNNKDMMEVCVRLQKGASYRLRSKCSESRQSRFYAAVKWAKELKDEDLPPEAQEQAASKSKQLEKSQDVEEKKSSSRVVQSGSDVAKTLSKQETLEELLKRRETVAKNLGIDPTLIACKAALDDVVTKRTKPRVILCDWQSALLQIKPPCSNQSTQGLKVTMESSFEESSGGEKTICAVRDELSIVS